MGGCNAIGVCKRQDLSQRDKVLLLKKHSVIEVCRSTLQSSPPVSRTSLHYGSSALPRKVKGVPPFINHNPGTTRHVVLCSRGTQTRAPLSVSSRGMGTQTHSTQSTSCSLSSSQPSEMKVVKGGTPVPVQGRLASVKRVDDPFQGSLFRVYGMIGRQEISCLIDSGSSSEFIALAAVKSMGLNMSPIQDHPGVQMANGHVLPITHRVVINLALGSYVSQIPCDVVPGLHHVLVLGLAWLSRVNPLISWQHRTLSIPRPSGLSIVIRAIAEDNRFVTETPLGMAPETEATPTQTSPPCSDSSLPLSIPPSLQSPSVNLMSAKQVHRMLKKSPDTPVHMVFVNTLVSSDGLVLQANLLDTEAMLKGYEVAHSIASEGVKVDAQFDIVVSGIENMAIRNALEGFGDRFPQDLPGLPPLRPGYDIQIETDPTAKPFYRPMNRYSPLQLQEMKDQIDYLLERGLIQPSQSPYGAAILFAPKKDGALRMCIDYRMLNKATVKSRFPPPHTEEHLMRPGGNALFLKLDLRSGYWQLRIAPEHAHKTAFRSRYGHFEWRVMLFGLTGAPGHFSALITDLLRPYLDLF